ncbi:MAG: preprotein translocase subunit SecE [Candidatus Kaiserbacteria bacterium]|nr:preprotein translocase subunit SecE [Candidatus Kaiserbacteria bacterium]
MLQYFAGAAGEFKQIRWLSTKRALLFSVIVVVTSFVAGFALGAVDSLFATLLKSIVI